MAHFKSWLFLACGALGCGHSAGSGAGDGGRSGHLETSGGAGGTSGAQGGARPGGGGAVPTGEGGASGAFPADLPRLLRVDSPFYGLYADGERGVVAVGQADEIVRIDRFLPNGDSAWSIRIDRGYRYGGFGGGALDQDGNLFLALNFQGAISLFGQNLTSTVNPGEPVDSNDPHGMPSADACLLKLDPAGQLLWLRHFPGVADQLATGLARAKDGTLGLAVSLSGRITLDETTSLVSSRGAVGADLLLVRFDADGKVLTTKQFAVPHLPASVSGLAFDSQGNLLVSYPALLDPAPFATFGELPRAGWVAKFDSNLTPLWLVSTDASDGPSVTGLAVDSQDSVVLALDGYSNQNSFGEVVGSRSIGIAKLDANGALLFSHNYGQNKLDHASAVSVLPDDSIAFTGSFYDHVDFGEGTITSLEPDMYRADVFIEQLDASGQHVRTLYSGGSESDWGFGIAALDDGSLVASGYTQKGLDFGLDPTRIRGTGYYYLAWFPPLAAP